MSTPLDSLNASPNKNASHHICDLRKNSFGLIFFLRIRLPCGLFDHGQNGYEDNTNGNCNTGDNATNAPRPIAAKHATQTKTHSNKQNRNTTTTQQYESIIPKPNPQIINKHKRARQHLHSPGQWRRTRNPSNFVDFWHKKCWFKVRSAHNFRTAPDSPKRLPRSECFASYCSQTAW